MSHIIGSRWTLKAVALVVALVFVTATAEVVHLKDGSRITGTIQSQTATEIVVRTTYGTLTIDKADVASIDFGGVQPEPTPAPAPAQPDQYLYSRGYADGESRGHQDGVEEAKAAQKNARLQGSLVGWLVWTALVVALVLSAR